MREGERERSDAEVIKMLRHRRRVAMVERSRLRRRAKELERMAERLSPQIESYEAEIAKLKEYENTQIKN